MELQNPGSFRLLAHCSMVSFVNRGKLLNESQQCLQMSKLSPLVGRSSQIVTQGAISC